MAELPSVGSLIVPCQTTITLTDLESLRLISVYGLAGPDQTQSPLSENHCRSSLCRVLLIDERLVI